MSAIAVFQRLGLPIREFLLRLFIRLRQLFAAPNGDILVVLATACKLGGVDEHFAHDASRTTLGQAHTCHPDLPTLCDVLCDYMRAIDCGSFASTWSPARLVERRKAKRHVERCAVMKSLFEMQSLGGGNCGS